MPVSRSGVAVSFLLCLLLGSAGCSSAESDKEVPAPVGPTAAPTTRATSTPSTEAPVARSAPRWETVATFEGSGSFRSPPFEILDQAIQWRVRWTCPQGTLRITSMPTPKGSGPLVDARCPANGDAYSIVTGPLRLTVTASADWTAVVDQQVDTPLYEPLPPDVAAAPVIAEGSFYPVEKVGKGTVRLHRLPDGRRVLRFDNFEVTHNTDLFVWLSEARRPLTSIDAIRAPRVVIGNLKSTLGNQNYDVPADLPTERLRSVVIWCEPLAIAYSAAALQP